MTRRVVRPERIAPARNMLAAVGNIVRRIGHPPSAPKDLRTPAQLACWYGNHSFARMNSLPRTAQDPCASPKPS